MAISRSEAVIIAKEKMHQGEMTAAQANVYIVQLMGVMLIEGKLTSDVRSAYNAAVKNGELGHIKKDGLKPEAYHHKNARAVALDKRSKVAVESIERLRKVFAPASINEIFA